MLSQVSQEEEEEVFFRELLVWKDPPPHIGMVSARSRHRKGERRSPEQGTQAGCPVVLAASAVPVLPLLTSA